MWTVIHIAVGKSSADKVVTLLKEQGILATLRRAIARNEDGIYEVLVAECEAEDAQEALRAGTMRQRN